MKLKKTIIILIMLSVIIIGMNANNITQAENITEEKIYCSTTLEDEFTDNEILIVITNEESLKFSEYTVNSFSEINCIEVTDLTDGYKEKIEQQLNGTYEGNMPVKLETFNRILKLTLGFKSKEYVLSSIKELEKRNDLISATPNYIVEQDVVSVSSPNDDYFSNQWAFDNINMQEAWDISRGLTSLKIGIIDSGIDATHEDLTGKVDTTLSKSFSSTYSNPLIDETGHGTVVSGIIGANTNNEIGVSGICWNTTLVSLKILSSIDSKGNGVTSLALIAEAVEYAEINEIKILNCSYGGTKTVGASELKNVLENYSGLFVCSAGNDYSNNDEIIYYPSNYAKILNNVISVGASTSLNQIWINTNSDEDPGSNYGETTVDLFAPGVNIYTTYPTSLFSSGYAIVNGTSAATPFVTGVAALMMAYYPNMSVQEIKSLIVSNTNYSSYLEGKCISEGILDAYKSLSSHNHIYGDAYDAFDTEKHWNYCYCGQRKLENHTWVLSSTLDTNMIHPDAVPGSRQCIYCGVLKLDSNI